MMKFEDQMERLTRALRDCYDGKLWGKVTLQLAEGNVVEFQVTQTVKVESEKLEPIVCVRQRDKSESRSEPSPRSQELSNHARPKGVSDEHGVRR